MTWTSRTDVESAGPDLRGFGRRGRWALGGRGSLQCGFKRSWAVPMPSATCRMSVSSLSGRSGTMFPPEFSGPNQTSGAGYYARIHPLKPGDHVVEFGGSLCGDYPFSTAATYHLHVGG